MRVDKYPGIPRGESVAIQPVTEKQNHTVKNFGTVRYVLPRSESLWGMADAVTTGDEDMSGLETCRALGIDFVSVTEAVDTSPPAGELVFEMIGAVAQFERSLIAERVKSELANARAKGTALGRSPHYENSRPQKAVSSEWSERRGTCCFAFLARSLECHLPLFCQP